MHMFSSSKGLQGIPLFDRNIELQRLDWNFHFPHELILHQLVGIENGDIHCGIRLAYLEDPPKQKSINTRIRIKQEKS